MGKREELKGDWRGIAFYLGGWEGNEMNGEKKLHVVTGMGGERESGGGEMRGREGACCNGKGCY